MEKNRLNPLGEIRLAYKDNRIAQGKIHSLKLSKPPSNIEAALLGVQGLAE